MKYICIVEPLNDTKHNHYLFTYEFGRPPVKDMIVHCETRLKNGMYGKITEWARVPQTDEEQLIHIISSLAPNVTLPLRPVDIIFGEAERRESE